MVKKKKGKKEEGGKKEKKAPMRVSPPFVGGYSGGATVTNLSGTGVTPKNGIEHCINHFSSVGVTPGAGE